MLSCDGPRKGRDKDIPGYRSSGKIRVASRQCTAVSVAPPGGEKITDSRFLRFFVLSVPLFRSLMLTPMNDDDACLLVQYRFRVYEKSLNINRIAECISTRATERYLQCLERVVED